MADQLPSWADGRAKTQILEFVQSVTQPGSNPVAPHQVSQLDGFFETLIADPVTTAGKNRYMLPDRQKAPGGQARRPANSGPVLLMQGDGHIVEPGTGDLIPLPAFGRLGCCSDVG
jgi:hypothetical protein